MHSKVAMAFISVLVMALSSFAGLSFLGDSGNEMEVLALQSVDPIRIESNTELYYHSQVDSGSGTAVDPFVISDIQIDCRSSGETAIYLRNTTYHLEIKNVTIFASSSSPAIYLRAYYSGGYHSMNLELKNITIIGGGTQLYMYVPIRVYITECNFSNPSGSGHLIDAYYGYYVDIHNNTFNSPGMNIYLDRTYYVDFTRNSGTIQYFYQNRYRYSDISNNTFNARNFYLYSGYFSDFQGNILNGTSSSQNLCYLNDCNRIKIANNTFIGGNDAIYVQHPNAYDPVRNGYESWSSLTFEYNIFNGSGGRGIYFHWATNYPSIAYMDIHHNRFIGCSDYAIELNSGGSPTSMVYRNIFMYNHGSGESYSGLSQQARDGWSQFRWSKNNVGNYWLDWDNEDQNSDGFSDESDYKLSSNNGQTDPDPVSNMYFDFGQPYLNVLTPATRFLDERYVNFTWEAYDNETGLEMVQIRKNMGKWINITGRDHHGLYLTNGQFSIDMRAVDMGGLKKATSLNLVIQNGREPVSIISPKEGDFHGTGVVEVSWSVEEGFVPLSLSCKIDDGDWVQWDPFEDHSLDLSDGIHTYQMRFSDHYGNNITRTITFTVDTRSPVLEILYPVDSSVISNRLVNFRWVSEDLSEIMWTNVTIDGEIFTGIEGESFSSFLDMRWHSFSVEVCDMAGNRASDSIAFRISQNTSLHITAPRLKLPSRQTSFLVEWEYLTSLEIESIVIILDENDPLSLSEDTLSYQVAVSEDGVHTISIEAKDPSGNLFSDSVEVIVDRTAPSVGFIGIENGTLFNVTKVSVQWGAFEERGISGYDLFVDDQQKMNGGQETESTLDLTEGDHTIRIIAHDLAGNSDQEQIDVVVDITRPTLELVSPQEDVLTDSYLRFEWEGTDLYGLDHYNYTVDGKGPFELGLSQSREIQLEEGQHLFILNCMDRAGNTRTLKKSFKVDLNPPEVEISNIDGEYLNEWPGLVEWSVIESMGIATITLEIDGVDSSLSNDSRYQMTDLDDGPHEITVTVTDIGGWSASDTASFILDREDPEVISGEVSVEGNSVILHWSMEENGEGIRITSSMDGVETLAQHDTDAGTTTFREVPEGEHDVNITFIDRAGNSMVLTFEFEVKDGREEERKQEGGGSLVWILLILIVIVVAVIVSFLILRKKKQSPQEEDKESKTISRKPDKISIGPIPARRETSHGPPPKKEPAPAPSSPRSFQPPAIDDSYIRPERKKRPQIKRSTPSKVPPPEKKPESVEEDIIEDWSDTEEFEELEELEEI